MAELKTNEHFVFDNPQMDNLVKPQPTEDELEGKNPTINIDY